MLRTFRAAIHLGDRKKHECRSGGPKLKSVDALCRWKTWDQRPAQWDLRGVQYRCKRLRKVGSGLLYRKVWHGRILSCRMYALDRAVRTFKVRLHSRIDNLQDARFACRFFSCRHCPAHLNQHLRSAGFSRKTYTVRPRNMTLKRCDRGWLCGDGWAERQSEAKRN